MATFNMEVYMASVRSEKTRKKLDYIAMQQLVIEHIHPSQFKVLPPSPKEIEHKAWILGISVYL